MVYFSNNSDGEILDVQCADCPMGGGGCPVAQVQHLYNYDQLRDGQEKLQEAMSMLIDDKGTCRVRKKILENVTRVPASECLETFDCSSGDHSDCCPEKR